MTPANLTGAPVRPGRLGRLGTHADELYLRISGRRRTPTDAVLVGLTWIAFALSCWLLFFSPTSRSWRDGLLWADAAVAVAVALAICWRWLRFRIGWRFLRKHWWELPALIPLALTEVGGLADHRLVLGLMVILRFARAADRLDNYYGDKVTAALIGHFLDPIIDTIKRPITVAVLDEVIEVIQQGDYATNVRAALDENRGEIEAMVLELIREDPTTGKLRYVPFHSEIVNLTSDTVLRIIEGALADPRTTELISDIIRNSATQLRAAVREEH